MEEKTYTGGFRLACLGAVLLVAVLVGTAFAGEFDPSVSPTQTASSTQTITFTINNTDSSENITNVTIDIPTSFVLVEDSNSSSISSGIGFENTSSIFTWWNTTNTTGGLVNLSTDETFAVDFSNLTYPGVYIFNVTVFHTNGQGNSTNVTFSVNDTTAPASITLITPTNDTWTNLTTILANFSFTEFNPDTCIYDNSSINQTTSTDSGYCNFTVTGYAEGSWVVFGYVNDTSGNLGVSPGYTFNYDALAPVGNTLGIFHQNSNVSGGNISQLSDVTISANITDALSGINTTQPDAVWANVTKGGAVVAIVNLTHTSGDIFNGTWSPSANNSGPGDYEVNVTAMDIAGNSQTSLISGAVEILEAPDLVVQDVAWMSNNANSGWPTSSNHIMLNITVANIGTGNFTGTFNVTTRIDGTLKNTSTLEYLNQSETFVLNLTFLNSNFSTNKRYIFLITIDPEDVVNESTENNNTHTEFISLGYNITLRGIYNGSASTYYPEVAKAFPDNNITINFTVKYANDSGVTGLSSEFEFMNRWNSQSYNITSRLSDFTEQGAGNYSIVFDTEDLYSDAGGNMTRARHGNNQFNVSIYDGDYTSMSLLLYNITAPDLSVHIDIDDIDMDDGTWHDFNLSITNNGNAPALNVKIDDPNDWEYTDTFYDLDPDGDLTDASIAPGETVNFPQGIYDLKIEPDATDDGSDENLFVFVNYNDSAGNGYIGYDDAKVDVIDSGVAGDDGGDDAGSTGGADSNLEFELSIIDWEDEVLTYPGEYNVTEIEVKNTGDITAVVKVSWECDDLEFDNVDVSPTSKSVGVGIKQIFIIAMDVPDDAEIGEYDCVAKAYVSTSTDDYDEETIVLRVQATETEVLEINQEYENLTVQVQELFDRFTLVNPALVNDTNLTAVENLLDNVNETLVDISSAIDQGDFIQAKSLIQALQASMVNTENSLEDLEVEQTMGGGVAISGTWFWAVIIIVVVIAVAFVAYLFFPQKGYGSNKNILGGLMDSLKGGSSKIGKIKDSGKGKLGSIKKDSLKPSSYTGAVKSKTFQPEGKGFIQKLKEKLKRKKSQKEVTSYFSSSSNRLIQYS